MPPLTTLDQAILRWRYDGGKGPDVLPDIRSRFVGGAAISIVSGRPVCGWRDRALIEEEKEPFIGIVCNLRGREECFSDGRRTQSREGDVMVWRSDAELRFEVLDDSAKLIILVPQRRFSAAMMPFTWHQSARAPMGAVLSAFFTPLATHIHDMDERSAECALETGLDLIARSIAAEQDRPAMARTTLFDRIVRFIDRHLEEELSPRIVANAHGISLRYLHLLFARQDSSVSAWIRERRLLRCQEELAMPHCALSLTEIAQRWRFCDSAHFSRSFKSRFGLPPRDWRAEHLGHACA